ncbi:hypothetical protein ACHAXR_006247 [Thalassiosira sp. AJA248-18]
MNNIVVPQNAQAGNSNIDTIMAGNNSGKPSSRPILQQADGQLLNCSVSRQLSSASTSMSAMPLKDFIAVIDNNGRAAADDEVPKNSTPTSSNGTNVFVPNDVKYDQTIQKLQETQRRLEQTIQHDHDGIRAQAETLLYWAESAEETSQQQLERKPMDPPSYSNEITVRTSSKHHRSQFLRKQMSSFNMSNRDSVMTENATDENWPVEGRQSIVRRLLDRISLSSTTAETRVDTYQERSSGGSDTESRQVTGSASTSSSKRSRPPPPRLSLPCHGPAWPDMPKEKLTSLTKSRRVLRIWYKQKIAPYWKITVAQLFCVAYILVLTFSDAPVGITDPETKDIIDTNSVENTNNGVIYVNGSYRAVVAIGGYQKICLAISRMSAFSMYPMIVVVFITKMKALQSFFAKTPLSMYLGVLKEGHDYHIHAGRYIAFDVWLHTLFHLLRWAHQGNIKLLWTSVVGLTGLITVTSTPLIAFPMMYYKDKIRYEIRKGLHYLFYVFAIAMCFHVPPSGIPNGGFIAPILGTCVVVYTLDAAYVYFFMTEKVETTAFAVLSSGVRISMPVSERFQKHAGRAGYAYICLPWINDKQWHAFSLFEDPSDPSIQQMFLMKNGDWTNTVHAALSRDTTRPCWIKGPFPSPYSHASLYDNQILVASGIGITPALAAINAFKSSRRINLIWAVRDPEMLEFFLEHLYLDHDGWNLIFYTGKEPLASDIEESNPNVRVINGRPQLSSLIPNIVYGNEIQDKSFRLYEENEVQNMCVKRLDNNVMASWGTMYCGGSKQVISALEEVSNDYNIDLHIDSFAW